MVDSGRHQRPDKSPRFKRFLTFINVIGIWRWLGCQRANEDGGQSAKRASYRSTAPELFTAAGLARMEVRDSAGDKVGSCVEGLLCCHTGQISYVVVRCGGVGGVQEELRAIARNDLSFSGACLELHLTADHFSQITPPADGAWPGSVAPLHDANGEG
ncbi:PRC-barrel domain containing protein [Novosphingobium terrae]|uniref:PRC-barrel domain containing protein n=1 Tax=Novosphingobium terrae TaxID=2726189 RepID=UPI00197FAD6F|nr:PRC-barrel domain containing protein [Novosphingobium terrae]